ncbi:hypothetical protein MZM54_03100 [[Brevibacterium] frigoritolerans]|nr:hypothetical protein [Peribacillus frigoritolerans]
MEENQVPSAVVNPRIYNKMMDSSIALLHQIQQKVDKGDEIITQEEADFANDFLAYSKEIVEVLEKQGL